MKTSILFQFLFIILFFSSCQSDQLMHSEKKKDVAESTSASEKTGMPLPSEVGKIYTLNDRKFMYGGQDSTWNFDVTNGILKDNQYHYGIGRETFHALIEPEFISLDEANTEFADSADFLFLQIGEDKRAYSIELLTHHEVVNDVVNGESVMAAYCVLADLGAIYHRVFGGKVFTFGLSGYTYFDPEVWNGTDGFVFWDRETESTWWPLIGKGVSGSMLNVPLQEYNEDNWKKMTWQEIKASYSDVKVLKPGQSMEPPSNWVRYDSLTIANIKSNL